MRAMVQTRYGRPADVLRMAEVDAPRPGADEVLVRVHATSVNTPDWATVTGEPYVLRVATGITRPRRRIRGTDVAGVVEAAGEGVTEFRPGDHVLGAATDRARVGTFADFTVVPAHRLTLKPSRITFEDAAASVMAGLTALDALRVAEVGRGTRLLVNGASGGVGTFLVQLAHRAGAEVTGVCSGRNDALVRSMGADHVIDHTRSDFTAREGRYDVVIDNVLNHPPGRVLRTLAPNGVLVPNSVGNTGGWFAGLPRMASAWARGVLGADVRTARCRVTRAHLEVLIDALLDGVRVVVDGTYSLDEAASAVERMLGHHARGKVVIRVAAGATASP